MTPDLIAAWNHLVAFKWHKRKARTWRMAALDLALIREACDMQEERIAFDMRDHGCSWREVGEALGISRQRAMQRYAGPESSDTRDGGAR